MSRATAWMVAQEFTYDGGPTRYVSFWEKRKEMEAFCKRKLDEASGLNIAVKMTITPLYSDKTRQIVKMT